MPSSVIDKSESRDSPRLGLIAVQELQSGLALGHDGGERLIDLVGDRRGEFAHRRQPIHVGEFRLQLAQPLMSLSTRLRSVISMTAPT
jgi:hypothetical protein